MKQNFISCYPNLFRFNQEQTIRINRYNIYTCMNLHSQINFRSPQQHSPVNRSKMSSTLNAKKQIEAIHNILKLCLEGKFKTASEEYEHMQHPLKHVIQDILTMVRQNTEIKDAYRDNYQACQELIQKNKILQKKLALSTINHDNRNLKESKQKQIIYMIAEKRYEDAIKLCAVIHQKQLEKITIQAYEYNLLKGKMKILQKFQKQTPSLSLKITEEGTQMIKLMENFKDYEANFNKQMLKQLKGISSSHLIQSMKAFSLNDPKQCFSKEVSIQINQIHDQVDYFKKQILEYQHQEFEIRSTLLAAFGDNSGQSLHQGSQKNITLLKKLILSSEKKHLHFQRKLSSPINIAYNIKEQPNQLNHLFNNPPELQKKSSSFDEEKDKLKHKIQQIHQLLFKSPSKKNVNHAQIIKFNHHDLDTEFDEIGEIKAKIKEIQNLEKQMQQKNENQALIIEKVQQIELILAVHLRQKYKNICSFAHHRDKIIDMLTSLKEHVHAFVAFHEHKLEHALLDQQKDYELKYQALKKQEGERQKKIKLNKISIESNSDKQNELLKLIQSKDKRIKDLELDIQYLVYQHEDLDERHQVHMKQSRLMSEKIDFFDKKEEKMKEEVEHYKNELININESFIIEDHRDVDSTEKQQNIEVLSDIFPLTKSISVDHVTQLSSAEEIQQLKKVNEDLNNQLIQLKHYYSETITKLAQERDLLLQDIQVFKHQLLPLNLQLKEYQEYQKKYKEVKKALQQSEEQRAIVNQQIKEFRRNYQRNQKTPFQENKSIYIDVEKYEIELKQKQIKIQELQAALSVAKEKTQNKAKNLEDLQSELTMVRQSSLVRSVPVKPLQRVTSHHDMMTSVTELIQTKNQSLQIQFQLNQDQITTIQKEKDLLEESLKQFHQEKVQLLSHQKQIETKCSELENNLQNLKMKAEREEKEYHKLLNSCKQKDLELQKQIKNKRQLEKKLHSLRGESTPQKREILHLFTSGLIFQDYEQEERIFLLKTLQSSKGKIRETKLLYKYDIFNKANFHKYVDKKNNIVIIIKTQSKQLIAAYSEECFDMDKVTTKFGFIASLNKQIVFPLKNNKRALTYDDYYLIWGNSEIRIKSLENKIFSNFAINNSFYETKGEAVSILLGQENTREVYLKTYEVYQVEFY